MAASPPGRGIHDAAKAERSARRSGVSVLQPGDRLGICCSTAGSFGSEQGHDDVSMRCGERGLLPAVRRAEADTLLITDGFSCREQIAQATGRQSLHLAQVLQMALHQGSNGRADDTDKTPLTITPGATAARAGAAALAATVAGAAPARQRNRK